MFVLVPNTGVSEWLRAADFPTMNGAMLASKARGTQMAFVPAARRACKLGLCSL